MPADVTGVALYRDPVRGFEFQPGPVFTDLLLADEINRAPAKTQAALLEAMAERQVTADGVEPSARLAVHRAGDAESGRARGNVPASRGAARPVSAQDRHRLSGGERRAGRCSRCTSRASIRSAAERPRSSTPVITADEARACRALVDQVRVAPEVREYIAAITRATREDPSLVLGASPRASVALMRAGAGAAPCSRPRLRHARRREGARAGGAAASRDARAGAGSGGTDDGRRVVRRCSRERVAPA